VSTDSSERLLLSYPGMSRRVTSVIRLVTINVLMLAAILVAIEGTVSWFLVARDIVLLPWVAQPYTMYDPDLGWVNKPNVSLQHMFGTDAWIKTNSRSFRNAAEVAPVVAPGRYRVICSGDSFTFGDGVDNDHTWCGQLPARDSRIEAVNLGEGGYGADQAYLRYLRDARDLEHQAHVFAFIGDDFVRMEDPVFLGFGKPILAIENGELVARNIPVPSLASRYPWLIAIPKALDATRTGNLIARVMKKYRPAASATGKSQEQRDERTRTIVRMMFANLKRLDAAGGTRLVLLYQPVLYDLDTTRPSEWTRFIEATAQELQIPLVNVLDDMRSRGNARELFLDVGTAGGHYSNAGHALVADLLYKELSGSMPAK
jgi:hypothetical protein